ncbi:MAG: hypothetical protein K2J24_04325, partial [Muribaculaceae bacterium]|nr:hypothetical protein [Muribaculaceae bacterium]
HDDFTADIAEFLQISMHLECMSVFVAVLLYRLCPVRRTGPETELARAMPGHERIAAAKI